jgi:predicted Rossmann-fold nucleotide-binding protein
VSGFWPLTFQEQSMQGSKATYAGIGSRETPQNILARMEQLGRRLAEQGLVLRTGNCRGADQAFAHGA